eukprot:352331-Chlamydomonas_euryale.AAC.2
MHACIPPASELACIHPLMHACIPPASDEHACITPASEHACMPAGSEHACMPAGSEPAMFTPYATKPQAPYPAPSKPRSNHALLAGLSCRLSGACSMLEHLQSHNTKTTMLWLQGAHDAGQGRAQQSHHLPGGRRARGPAPGKGQGTEAVPCLCPTTPFIQPSIHPANHPASQPSGQPFVYPSVQPSMHASTNC